MNPSPRRYRTHDPLLTRIEVDRDAMGVMAQRQAGELSGSSATIRTGLCGVIGQVFDVAVLGALVYAQLPGSSGTGRPLGPAQQAAFVAGLHLALWVCGLALLAAAVPVIATSTPTSSTPRSLRTKR